MTDRKARTNHSSGSHFEAQYGYSRAVSIGEMIFVSGTVGMDYAKAELAEGASAQVEQIAANMGTALAMADAKLSDIVQICTYIDSPDLMAEVGAALGRVFGDIRPTNTVVVVSFPAPGVLIEISAIAVRSE